MTRLGRLDGVMIGMGTRTLLTGTLLATLAACAPPDGNAPAEDGTATAAVGTAADSAGSSAVADPGCAPDNGGITLPQGFCATVFADDIGRARHIVVRDDGTVFVSLAAARGGNPAGGIVALRDTTGDGVADVTERFGPEQGGSGIDLRGEWLYFAPDDGVMRYRVPAGALRPEGEPETLVTGLPDDRSHTAKTIAVGSDGSQLFVNVGSPSNSCQDPDRQSGVPGQDPCPELETRAGIWRFDANATGQTQQGASDRFATGIRNAVAIAVHPTSGDLYAMQHGRDQLTQNWGDLFDEVESAEKPAEEFLQVGQGDDFGWPYCYYDPATSEKVLAPEYGGDGTEVGRCADKKDPIYGFPAHWAPNDLLFYTGSQFPAKYREGVFVAFHGSWNRAPEPQAGYNVAFLPMSGPTAAAGAHEIFADGFAGGEMQPGDAEHRPTGLAQGPDGALYITSDQSGRVWRVVYTGM
jgi:glucose/arabinose dehydrogenase